MPDNDGSAEEGPVLRLRRNSTHLGVGNPAVLVSDGGGPVALRPALSRGLPLS